MKPIVFHAEAEAELDETIAWYENRRDGLGIEFQAEVEAVIRGIQDKALLGSQYPETDHRFVIVPRFPYLICFLETDSMLWISAIAHERREPAYWEHRAPDE